MNTTKLPFKKGKKEIYYYTCLDCGFSGSVTPHGYIGRCLCGSYNVKVINPFIKKNMKINKLPFKIGEKYFIRTVTYFCTGEVVAIHGKFIELTTPAWIPDTGRFADALKSGEFSEVEPVNTTMFVNTASVVDAFVWKHKLPAEQK